MPPVEVILFPDAENLLRVFLESAFDTRPGFTTITAYVGKKPATLPNEFVFIRRTGGPARDLVTDLPQLTFEFYAKTGTRAVAMAGLACGLIDAAARTGDMGGVTIYTANRFSGPYLDPDPLSPTFARYSVTYQIAVRGIAA